MTAPPPAGDLSAAEAHAWLVDLDRQSAAQLWSLDSGERERAASYLSPRDGARFVASRAALRLIIGRYLSTDPASVRFRHSTAGRLELAAPDPAGLQFSLARTAGLALIAVALGPVGADLEQVTPRAGLADLANSRFSPAESRCITSGCAGSPRRSFYRHWTAKEAYLKAVGIGLAGLRDTELDCRPGASAITFRGRPQAGFRVCTPEISPAIAAAVVASSPVSQWRQLAP
jgi:4'-phosphopantetheinyl transferase